MRIDTENLNGFAQIGAPTSFTIVDEQSDDADEPGDRHRRGECDERTVPSQPVGSGELCVTDAA